MPGKLPEGSSQEMNIIRPLQLTSSNVDVLHLYSGFPQMMELQTLQLGLSHSCVSNISLLDIISRIVGKVWKVWTSKHFDSIEPCMALNLTLKTFAI